MSQFGILLQFGHRISAVVVGAILIWMRTKNKDVNSDSTITKLFDILLLFYFLNILLGGLYIISATEGNFPEWVSLLHLLIGALTFLTSAFAYLTCTISEEVKS